MCYRLFNYFYTYLFKALINPADISSFGAESRPVQIAFLKNWPDSQKVPLQNYALLDLIETSIAWKESQTATNTPTLVISKNGVSRAGIYCASSICTNKLNNEGEVDVFNAVRTVMQNRPQLIENLIEYTYLYTMMNGLAETVPMEELDMEPALTPLMVNVYNHNYSSSETTKFQQLIRSMPAVLHDSLTRLVLAWDCLIATHLLAKSVIQLAVRSVGYPV
ncbi:hypothetical protein EB796_015379 [Bugula neritina]|uniref:Uncharacterized protein n=1 Tax=Bugula neritina TaxID=10212 RepID=A0A7J7JJ52_BUGNE|nr:hypothetical protein EB796_015379 [Bugula neritina]